ncbi:ORC-CDC6 family AAA ATPase [Paenarthrobacter nitroguajacolicus]|uniref:ORC-CDC6 family AAA ATPase n=1 Tax=Paenarthrobacter nitroguajacolicus TaxID=211146 RepID=UPI0040543C04
MNENPFEVTKAVDFTDDQIIRNYVAFAKSDSSSIVNPRSAMPQFLVGGKGGGRTHLMRYFAYSLQRMRSENVLAQVQRDGYMGIYFRCSGLNGSRFAGKGQPVEAWDSVFAFYMDLWLTEQLLLVLEDICSRSDAWPQEQQETFTDDFVSSLSGDNALISSIQQNGNSLLAVLKFVMDYRSTMDRAINNAALTRKLDIEILSTPGEMIFALCKSASQNLDGLKDVRFTFLVDEYENFNIRQQQYFNTLIREKQLPACFLIGGREWGVRTHSTLSANEENKRGSEFEWIVLEDSYQHGAKSYTEFCRDMVMSRLRSVGSPIAESRELDFVFGDNDPDRFKNKTLLEICDNVPSLQRKHLQNLQSAVRGVTRDSSLTRRIAEELSFEQQPLLEKLAILRFYQLWSQNKKNLGFDLALEARAYVTPLLDGTESSEIANFFAQRKSDLIAQVFWENGRRPPYLGFGMFVDMSGFLPRSLLMILKYVTHWALFLGEKPFEIGMSISQEAQNAGVRDAAKWFLSDAKPLGQEGEDCERAIRRLGSLLRMVRYSDKPTEVSISTFSTNLQGIDPRVGDLINMCVDHRLLVEITEGRTSRNRGSVHRKFQLHPMLAPLFGLPTGRRGVLALGMHEVSAIFDPAVDEGEFSRIAKVRLAGMNAPFSELSPQEALFDLH